MNTAQLFAADPKASAWVAASAGTGKTKVLTDRILNLLLQGYAPERIVCLTFTKAAAAEMMNRLTQRLAQWVTLPEPQLHQELEKLIGNNTIPPAVLTRARHLFTLVLDAPGGMKIQTIHGFCQSVLGRFPLEAGIPPHFRILDEVQAEEILLEAQQAVFSKPTPLIEAALTILNPFMADQRFTTLLNDFYGQRARVLALLSQYQTVEDHGRALLQFLEIESFVENPGEILKPDLVDQLKERFVPPGLDFEAYVTTYLTQKGEIRKKLLPDQLTQAESVLRFTRSLSSLELAQRTLAFLILFQEILTQYQDRKSRRCLLDYDDLIQQTQELLTQPGVAAWVLYKLDGGIDHLLVDEAQDTNAAQWQIIARLTNEFFTPDKPYRTIFIVGDAKQSIYSFQGANPHDFLKIKTYFSDLVQRMGQEWRDVQLDLSYRSTTAVLQIIDEVFSNAQNRRGVAFDEGEIVHQAFRDHHPGLVELWPLQEASSDQAEGLKGEWPLPLARVEHSSPQSQLAVYLADQVAHRLSSRTVLPSTGNPIEPRDILILVRKRSALVHEMIRALKKRDIPVAGSDRLVLKDHIAVMDLLALGQFVLLPEDDLNLACVLRSPLIGLSEEDLFTLAYGREGTLWACLSQKKLENETFQMAHEWLIACLDKADYLPVYEFYSWVLSQGAGWSRFLSRLGQEAEDALEEFLCQTLIYDHDHPSSLQGFFHFMTHQSQEIKRDAADTIHNQVRIMTIHGSKGLQAPIVILPDATESSNGKWDPLLWTENLVLLSPAAAQDTTKTLFFKQRRKEESQQENRRLLYVALTRAQDHLYIGGWTNGKDLPPDCWYKIIQNALEIKGGTGSSRYDQGDNQAPLYSTHQSSQERQPLPLWVKKPITEKKITTPETLQPKALSTPAMERGSLIHRFFEFLPTLPEETRYLAASQMIHKAGFSLADWEIDIQTTLTLLKDPHFEGLFSLDSLAEVPVIGEKDGKPFQGRIDRLLVTPDTLIIVDYKTNQNPPTDLEDIPEAYVQQLENYAVALKAIYPYHKIRKILLWTQGPYIHEV